MTEEGNRNFGCWALAVGRASSRESFLEGRVGVAKGV
jgi:hypothetical protein